MALPTDEAAVKPSRWRRVFATLLRPSSRWSVLALLVLGVAIGSVGVIGTQVAVHATGTNEFCVSCHEMTTVQTEYHDTGHFSNRTGVRAGCSDCHIPHAYPEKLWLKALSGTRDIYGHLTGVINTPEKFEARRQVMAASEQARLLKNGSAECRYCHDPAAMNPAKQKSASRTGHQEAKDSGKTCIECHRGIAHNEPTTPANAQTVVLVATATAAVAPAPAVAAVVEPQRAAAAATALARSAASDSKPGSNPEPAPPKVAAPAATAASAEKFDDAEMLKLAKRNNCAACHALSEKKKGPSYRDSAAKYRGKPDPTATLVARILAGGEGKDHPEVEVSEADATKLVGWILAQQQLSR